MNRIILSIALFADSMLESLEDFIDTRRSRLHVIIAARTTYPKSTSTITPAAEMYQREFRSVFEQTASNRKDDIVTPSPPVEAQG